MRAFTFYIDNWLSSKKIAKMDAHEERGYLRLILAAAGEEGPPSLPDDDEELAILSKLGPQWWKPTKDKEKRLGEKTSGKKLRECWTFKPESAFSGRLYNEKLYESWQKHQAFSETRSKVGKLGSEKRWQKHGKGIAKPSQKPWQNVAELTKGVRSDSDKESLSAEIWESGTDLLAKFPGASTLPGEPDETIVTRCFEIAHWDLEELSEALRKLHLSGQKPSISWAWFPKVLPQFVGNK